MFLILSMLGPSIFPGLFTSSLCVAAILSGNDNARQNSLCVDLPKWVVERRCGNGARLPIPTDLHLSILARASTYEEYVAQLLFYMFTCVSVFNFNDIFLSFLYSVISAECKLYSDILSHILPCYFILACLRKLLISPPHFSR